MGLIIKGIGVSKGIAIGNILLYKEPELNIIKKQVEDRNEEINRFTTALKQAADEIGNLYELALKQIGESNAGIFLAQKLMLEDPVFIKAVKDKITYEGINAEYAVNEVTNSYILFFEKIKDENLRLRVMDLKDVSKRLLSVLLNIESIDLINVEENTIIIAEDLTPSDTARMNKDHVIGIITELGGSTSHTSIIAKTLDIPLIIGIKDITSKVVNGEKIIINGDTGEIIISPTKEEIMEHISLIIRNKDITNKLTYMLGKESKSKDGYKVELFGNIGSMKDIDKVLENDGEGIGLFRTEFLYMDRQMLPTEEEQLEAYMAAATKIVNKPLIIRTLDVGGDKDIPYLNLQKEMNPFLGYRATRLLLDRLDIFKTQIRAILRASFLGNVKIMFPMISNIDEVRACKLLMEELKNELRIKKIPFNENIEIGIMVEIPSVAINSHNFAKEVDFFSIGTNDLIQYTLAVDRGNLNIAKLYNQYDPGVLKLIKMTIDNGHKEGIKVGMCGEAAKDKKLIPILLGMGLDDFSVNPGSILDTRYFISQCNKEKIEKQVEEVLNLVTAEEVEKYIDEKICNNLKF